MEEKTIKIYEDKLTLQEIKELALETFGDMAKAVIDIERKVIAVGGELHADAESLLLQDGSKQSNLWGINLYPDNPADELIEYTSLINIRPAVGNRSQEIQDLLIRQQIKSIIDGMNTKVAK